MACPVLVRAADEGDDVQKDSNSLLDDETSCELMLEALQEHLRSIEERLVELASDLLPSLTPPPGYSRSGADTGPVLNSREEERRRMEEDELREAKAKEKAKLLEEKMRHLEVLAGRERQYAVNRQRYLQLLSVHVEQQKLDVNKRQKRFEKRREKEQARERAHMIKKKPVRYRATGETDYTFLNHLPQTLFYKIVAMETELKKAGKLSSVQDVKEFWDDMLAPPSTPAAKVRRPSYKSSPLPTEDLYSSDYLEGEDSEDVTNSWAITATVSSSKNKFPRSRKSIMEHTRFIPTEVPVLKPLSELLDLDTASQKEEEEQLKKHKARIESYQVKNRTVNEMYQTARANEITMRRMLEESGLLHEEPLKILSSVESAQAKTQRSKSLPSRGRTNNFPVKRTHFSKGSKSLTDRVATSSSASSGQTQINMKRSSQAIEHPEQKLNKPIPLHIGAVEKVVPVKEARQTSLWKNYTKSLKTK